MDPRILLFIIGGIALWGAVALERPFKRLPISLPMLYVGLGWLLFALPLGLPALRPIHDEIHTLTAEYLTEFIVIVSLMGAGLAIDRPFSWQNWKQALPLIIITMPLSILAVGLLGWSWLGLAPAAAILLGASLSPTDPVLARSVQVGPPGDDERDDVRFNLTLEAGINDGLAFPFTYLAIAAVGRVSAGDWLLTWAAFDVLWRIVAGVVIGFVVAWVSAWYVFERSAETGDDTHANDRNGRTNEGLVVMATLLAAYGLAEIVEGYGFLAVFVGAVTARQYELRSNYHERTHKFVDQVEDVVLVGMLLGFGGLLASGVLAALTWQIALLGLLAILVIRPLTGIIALLGSHLPWAGRWAVAFLGIRGMGSIYYLAYGQTHANFLGIEILWAAISFTILSSIIIHGLTARPIMEWLETHKANVVPAEIQARTGGTPKSTEAG